MTSHRHIAASHLRIVGNHCMKERMKHMPQPAAGAAAAGEKKFEKLSEESKEKEEINFYYFIKQVRSRFARPARLTTSYIGPAPIPRRAYDGSSFDRKR